MQQYPVIGIRPIIDARRLGIRDELEGKTQQMAQAAKALLEQRVFYADGTPVHCVIASGSIACGEEAARCEAEFATQNVCATLSVTPSWCYPLETIDLNPLTIKAIWGFNGTERPGAVYLAAAISAHNQLGIPVFSIYSHDTQDLQSEEIPDDVQQKLISFAQCAVTVGQMRNKAYVSFGGTSMGIIGSVLDPKFYVQYLGIRPEWVDMTEVLRRIELGIYDTQEYKKALSWIWKHCPEGFDKNCATRRHTDAQKAAEWEFIAKLTLIVRDIMLGNEVLDAMGWQEEALGKNSIFAGFQGQRAWTDWKPNADFTEAIMNSSFDWNGIKQPRIFATESDNLNGLAMLFSNLLTGCAPGFADVRCYWSPQAVQRVSGWLPEGTAENGFIHLTNSGSACLDATAASRDETGKPVVKRWWQMQPQDVAACLQSTDWCAASLTEFRGGGFSSHFRTTAELPMTMVRVNLVDGVGPTLQIAEGNSCVLPEKVHQLIDQRTDPTWPCTWFAPKLTGEGAFSDVYSVMANWGANHGCFAYGHIGAELITLASMLRIPVSMHNVAPQRIFRPHSWSSFGTDSPQVADYRACAFYGPLYR